MNKLSQHLCKIALPKVTTLSRHSLLPGTEIPQSKAKNKRSAWNKIKWIWKVPCGSLHAMHSPSMPSRSPTNVSFVYASVVASSPLFWSLLRQGIRAMRCWWCLCWQLYEGITSIGFDGFKLFFRWVTIFDYCTVRDRNCEGSSKNEKTIQSEKLSDEK